MFDVIKKLMMARQITMEKGEIRLLGQRMTMAPAITFYYLYNVIPDDKLSSKLLYYACKVANTHGYTRGLSNQYGLKGEKLLQWMINSAQLAGWGEFEIVNMDIKNKKAILHMKNSAVASFFKGQKSPVDHVIRGYLAGAASLIFGVGVDYIETKCVATGDNYCEFICKKTEEFDFSNEIIAGQLDQSGEIEDNLLRKKLHGSKKIRDSK